MDMTVDAMMEQLSLKSSESSAKVVAKNCIICNEVIFGEENWKNHPKSDKHKLALIKYYLKTNRDTLIMNKNGVKFTSDSKAVLFEEEHGTLSVTLSVGMSLDFELLIHNTNSSTVKLISCHPLHKVSCVEIKDALNFSRGIKHIFLEPDNIHKCIVTVTASETCKLSVPIILYFSVNDEEYTILRFLVISCYHSIAAIDDFEPEEPYVRPSKNPYLFDKCDIIPCDPSHLETVEQLYPRQKRKSYPLPDQIVRFVANRHNIPKNMGSYDQQQLQNILYVTHYMKTKMFLLHVSWKEKVTNIVIIEKTKSLIGDYEPLLEMARRRKLEWFGHVTRKPGSMAHTVMHGMVEGTRNRGRPRKTWLSDIEKWTAALSGGLSEENYVDYLTTLLFFEEAQMNIDIRKYDLYDVCLDHIATYSDLLTLKVPGLVEKRPSLIKGDKIYARLLINGHLDEVEYEGNVAQILESDVKLSFNPMFLDNLYIRGMRFNIRFSVNRYPLFKIHQALNFYSEISHILFPKKITDPAINQNNDINKFYDKNIERNPEQREAVENIVKGTSKPSPFLLFGPPGTGKTVTLVESIKQCVLLLNSAADLLTDRLLTNIPHRQILRLNAATRIWSSIPSSVKCSNHNGTEFYFPNGNDIQKYRIVICTLITAGRLVRGHFEYVFVDEAGQCMEPEILIAVAGILKLSASAKKSGLLVLAGDPKQLGPVLRNRIAIKKGLGISLLERLMKNCDVYLPNDGKFNPYYVVKLLQNYRSHPSILQLPNRLFYKNELKACGDEVLINSLCNWTHLKKKGFPFIFHSVIGQDAREKSSPSYFNVQELDVVIDYVKKLLKTSNSVVLKPKDIGIISPYRKQVQKIRTALQKLKMDKIQDLHVGSTEEFQGQERRIVIISTVRSCPDLLAMDYEHHIGFLRNPKRFNVAITRAKALLIVVGNPHILLKDFHWKEMIQYCVENKSYIGSSLNKEDHTEDVLERCNYFGLRPESIDSNAAESFCISQKTNQEEPEWRWEH
ncbi:putative helicase mov-10-B.1 [Nymphon striatum]|nr:putative helicase mov-10-B.1 [Nymphon striatum]